MKTPPHDSLLVVEDCDEDFETIQEALLKFDPTPQVFRAFNGEQCLALLRGENAPPLTPALVLLDLNLPGRDGRDALQEIKTDAALRVLPVVVFTTSSNPRDLMHCFEAGANAYHIKPLGYTDYLKALHDVLFYWLRCVALPEKKGLIR